MTPSNASRAARAQNALQTYVEAKGEVFENSREEITDLIADLLHLLARDHVAKAPPTADDVIDSTLDLARLHFEAEQADIEENGGQDCAGFQKLIYMPRESTPTIATLGNREAIAYMELGERTDDYGRLFAKAPDMRNALLNVKRLAESGDDAGYQLHALLALIAQETRAALAQDEE
jgi:hypothetical protein